jgi:hypothetical protein
MEAAGEVAPTAFREIGAGSVLPLRTAAGYEESSRKGGGSLPLPS